MTKFELIEKLVEHEIDCFYEQSFKRQENYLRDIFTEQYKDCELQDLQDLCIDYCLIEEV